jgi:hypothetical protein
MKKDSKKFMEKVAHNPHMHHHSSHPKTRSAEYIGSDKRVHYGSGFMSDYHSSIKDARKRLENRQTIHTKKGGSMTQDTRVF